LFLFEFKRHAVEGAVYRLAQQGVVYAADEEVVFGGMQLEYLNGVLFF